MAMKGLIEAECGGANPLMKFANHFVPDGRNIHNLKSKPIEDASGQELANEFVSSTNPMYKTAPSTFNMQHLLHEIQQQQHIQPQQHQHIQPQQHQHIQPQQHIQHRQQQHQHQQHIQQQHIQQHQQQHIQQQHIQQQHQQQHIQPQHHQPQHNLMLPLDHEVLYHQQQNILNRAGGWAEEYTKQSMDGVAWLLEYPQFRQESFETAFESALSINPLHSSIQLDSNEIQGNSLMPTQNNAEVLKAIETEEGWMDEYKEQEHEDVWTDMVQEWKNFTDSWKENEMWEEEFQSLSIGDAYKEYAFEEANPLMMDGAEALCEGIKRMNEGDVANAVLFLETAVKQDPTNAMAWFYLGTSQADNEQEPLAIAAFNKCLELEPCNLKALLSLAVGYTNEGVPSKAYENLMRWISTNDKYKQFVQSRSTFEGSKTSHAGVLELFLQAVQLGQHNIDPDLQTCLGIIFNLSAEYDKAVDCFKTALQITPQDSMLWNKLGATLANGQMSEQSIVAYRNALSLRPGYVRTRFNLGVACVNLGAYRESIEHFLSALRLQNESKGPISQLDSNTTIQLPSPQPLSPSAQPASSSSLMSTMSSNIWQSLRLSLSLLGRHDLMEACDNCSLADLLREFNV